LGCGGASGALVVFRLSLFLYGLYGIRDTALRCVCPLLHGEHLGDRTHHGGIGFAGAGRHLDQAALTGEVGRPGLTLKRQRRPALLAEPGLDRRQKCVGRIGSLGLVHSDHPCTARC